ncbi:SDR family NAD(P)-dependent oxidoreductase [Nocardia brasiliensis]|uniref:SDR family NAD(P)-dependent oxidoreductase n=1 Tax=Nocardia brasiliensis TaxID=37326 RepID=UPI002454D5B0|nr:SDR family NAD(P)-dependent oxidoreductase [Nocardia brasiliensis]
MTRTWFITGANRGLGRAFTVAALAEGDRVVATARDPRTMADLAEERLTVLPLDVRDRANVIATVDKAFALMGTIDVIVNNAGYGLVGAIEELTEAQIRDQMDTNFYGALWVSQAAVPHLRAQGAGHIVQISTVGAVGSLPLFGMYNASKWALEGFSASLADELRPFGISVTLAQMAVSTPTGRSRACSSAADYRRTRDCAPASSACRTTRTRVPRRRSPTTPNGRSPHRKSARQR